MRKIYYAKSRQKNGQQVTVQHHTIDAITLAALFGAAFGAKGSARLGGLLHDFAKYSDAFQDVLDGNRSRVDHAISSAAYLLSQAGDRYAAYVPVIEAINAHHSELRSFEELEGLLRKCLESDEPHEGNDGKTAALNGKAQFAEAEEAFLRDFPDFKLPVLAPPVTTDTLVQMLFTRMLFSCLVDADYTVSAAEDGSPVSTPPPLQAEEWLKRLEEERQSLAASSTADASLNQIRNQLYELCGDPRYSASGLYTLTAPTGTGKTLALLHFALMQCIQQKKERIIIVLPFLTLTEQNTAIYRRIIGDQVVLEDHSLKELNDDFRQFAERWNAPFIVTTSVRFFEALFASKPSDCRKLHHIANSVVVFDEAQSLPPHLTSATLRAVQTLCSKRYRVTMLFSTATQPNFDALPQVKDWRPIELLPDGQAMYDALRRVHTDWRIRLDQRVPLSEIAQEMAFHSSVCAIVNLKRHARELFDHLRTACADDSVFYLTTELCPAHRREVVARIKECLQNHLPCRVVATQCIEAGVNLDFDCMYRSLAPLDAIIQAAGRCNRDGRLPDGGSLVVFEPADESLYPDTWYGDAATLVRELNQEHPIDIYSLSDIARYYDRLFHLSSDDRNLTGAIRRKDYALTAKEYRLIRQDGVQVIVPFSGELERFNRLRTEALANGMTAALMREAAPITVTMYDSKVLETYAERIDLINRRTGSRFPSGYYILRPQYEHCYRSEDTGLYLDKENLCLF